MGEPLSLDQHLRDLLHRSADQAAGLEQGKLTPEEQQLLRQLPAELQTAVTEEWANAVSQLQRPSMPESVAASVASDITLSVHFQQTAPHLPGSQAAQLAGEIRLAAQLRAAAPLKPVPSSAALLAARIAQEAGSPGASSTPAELGKPRTQGQELFPPHPDVRRGSRAAPLALVGSLIASLLLLTVTSAWPGLSAGASVLQGLLGSLPPTFGLGLALLLGTSLLLAFPRPPHWQLGGSLAFALSAALTFPALYSTLDSQGVSFGQDVVVEGQHSGPIIAVGGDILLQPGSRVDGQVLALLGDIQQEPGSQVSGEVTALLGQGPDQRATPASLPSTALSNLQLASATAIRPLLGWLGGTAWGALFWILTSALTLALFLSGAAGPLAARQSQAPLRTLALGVLALATLLLPASLLIFAGWLAPALGLSLLLVLLLALGLGVSAFDVGRQLACRLHTSVPDTFGVLIALLLLTATMAWPSLSLALILIGGAWGSGTLLVIRHHHRRDEVGCQQPTK